MQQVLRMLSILNSLSGKYWWQQLPATLLSSVNYRTFKGRGGYSDASACSSMKAFKELIELPEGWSLPLHASFEENVTLIGLRAGETRRLRPFPEVPGKLLVEINIAA